MFNVVINNEQYDEYLAQKEKIKELEEQVNDLKMQFELTYEHYQQALSEKAALIKERNEYKDLYMKQIIKCNELHFENDKVRNELESIKDPVASVTITPCRDLEEAYSPDRNTIIDIKNLYITNNYFSKEDKKHD